MSDDDKPVGSSAGDAAHTEAIPRITDDVKDDDSKPVTATTDKGRPRPSGGSKSSSSGPKKSGSSANKSGSTTKTAPSKSGSAKSGASKGSSNGSKKPGSSNGPTGRPLTASDYARTTSQSPSTTAVIPAVKDEPKVSNKAVAPPKNRPEPEQSRPTITTGEPSGEGRAATLRMSYIDPWSVTRMAFAISVAMMIVGVVAVAIFWVVLDATGVWTQIDGSVTSVLSDDSSTFQITDYLGFGRLVGLSLVLSAVNVVVMTILATIAAHLYNLGAQLLGGFEITYTSQD